VLALGYQQALINLLGLLACFVVVGFGVLGIAVGRNCFRRGTDPVRR